MKSESSGRGVLFDFDGTLVDTIPMLFEFYSRFLAERGKQGSIDEFQRLNGPSLPEVAQHLKKTHGLAESESEILKTYVSEIMSVYNEKVQPRAGADATLEQLRADGYRLALVTSNKSVIVMPFLGRAGWDRLFDIVVTGDEVEHAKPDPDIYLKALKKMGLGGDSAAAVEDSVNGVRSAAAAGCGVIGFETGTNGTTLLNAGAAKTVSSFFLLPDTLESLFGN